MTVIVAYSIQSLFKRFLDHFLVLRMREMRDEGEKETGWGRVSLLDVGRRG